jgi:hypothetical protein
VDLSVGVDVVFIVGMGSSLGVVVGVGGCVCVFINVWVGVYVWLCVGINVVMILVWFYSGSRDLVGPIKSRGLLLHLHKVP